jgi:isoleucyl-tRNA synthetase
VNPEIQIEQFGADAIRLFILGGNFMKAEPLLIDKDGLAFNEPIKTILTPLWNAYHFFTLYANAGNVKIEDSANSKDLPLFDAYITAELNELVKISCSALDEYAPERAITAFMKFLDILNNWYIRLNRQRFWDEEQSAFDVLYFVLTEFCKLLAPFAPFISDYIYKRLADPENKNPDISVHLEKFPNYKVIDNGAITAIMRKTQQIVSTGKQLREQYKLRNRQPLQSITITGWYDDSINYIIKSELNVKDVFEGKNIDDVAVKTLYPITPVIAKRKPNKMKEILSDIKSQNYDLSDRIYNNADLKIGNNVLYPDEYELRLRVKDDIAGAALPDNTAVVVLDTALTPELAAEGLVNDALRFIQDTRKLIGLDVSDRIKLFAAGDEKLVSSLKFHERRILADALATKIIYTGTPQEHATKIEGRAFSIKIEKI